MFQLSVNYCKLSRNSILRILVPAGHVTDAVLVLRKLGTGTLPPV